MKVEHDQIGRRLTMHQLEQLQLATHRQERLIQALLEQAQTTQHHPDLQTILLLLDHPDLQTIRLLLDHPARTTQARADLELTQAIQAALTKRLAMILLETVAMILTSVLLAILEMLTLAVAHALNQCRFARTRSDLTIAAAWLATVILTSESLLQARRQSVLMSAPFLDLSST